MSKSNYQEFKALPQGWSFSNFIEGQPVDPSPYKWSGKQAPPAIGDAVQVSMNGLGVGVVKGYFAEAGWLGLLVKLAAPPAWWLKQNKGNEDRLAHIFGTELS
jgi:hypothetical protein